MLSKTSNLLESVNDGFIAHLGISTGDLEALEQLMCCFFLDSLNPFPSFPFFPSVSCALKYLRSVSWPSLEGRDM